jgi:hypothetical protein
MAAEIGRRKKIHGEPLGQDQREAQRALEGLGEHGGQDERGHGKAGFAQQVSDDAEEQGHPHVEAWNRRL